MRPAAVGASVMLVLLLSDSPSRLVSASDEGTSSVPGLWSGTVFYGDPANPATPKEQFLATVHPEGTYGVDSTAATGEHPLNQGQKTEERGVWTRRGSRVVTHGFWFDSEGADAGFSLGRGVSVLELVARDRLEGHTDIDFLPCPSGPLGCPDPVDVGGLTLGSGFGPFPVVLRRVR